jgi:hypothetical protein
MTVLGEEIGITTLTEVLKLIETNIQKDAAGD